MFDEVEFWAKGILTFKCKCSALRREGREMWAGWEIYRLLSQRSLWEPSATYSLKFWFSCSQSDVREAQTVPKFASPAVIRTTHQRVLLSVKDEFIFVPMDLQPLCTLIVFLVYSSFNKCCRARLSKRQYLQPPGN